MIEELSHIDANEALAEGFNQLRRASDSEIPRRKPTWRDDIFTAKVLQQRQYPEVQWIIPGIIPEGLSILAGRPKIGKSWLALDIALAVAGGSECIGGFLPEHGDVLYCALEDNERRLKKRIGKLLGNDTMWPDRLTISTRWKRLNDGGARELVEWISSVPKPRLIILDTLASVRPINTRDGYAQDYAALEQVHRIANDYGIGIVVLHHQRKVEAQDPLDTISGTLGLAGCADTSLVLSGNSSGKSLYLRGRDVEEAEHAIQFDAQACRWKILGDAADVRRSETRNKILGVLKASDAPIGPKEIAEQSGLSEDVVKNRLLAMVKDGEVLKKGHGKYVLPD